MAMLFAVLRMFVASLAEYSILWLRSGTMNRYRFPSVAAQNTFFHRGLPSKLDMQRAVMLMTICSLILDLFFALQLVDGESKCDDIHRRLPCSTMYGQ